MLPAMTLFERGGVVIWIIACLSVLTLALILWKVWQLWRLGAWKSGRADAYEEALRAGRRLDIDRSDLRGRVALSADWAKANLSDDAAREETERVARGALREARTGLRALDAIATVAPLLGLLGTVLGMIAAFQALQEAGQRADPSVLAGGIWEALLTTAAGMAVAIPASLAVTWFDGVVEQIAGDMEDLATRILIAPATARAAAE